jgi:hypothetical protein
MQPDRASREQEEARRARERDDKDRGGRSLEKVDKGKLR